jgi:hypothetical protein
MTEKRLVPWAGLLVAFSGLMIAGYMLVHPWSQRTGDIATTPQWMVAHSLHFLGAVCLLPGLVGVYVRQKGATGRSGLAAFWVALVATALFAGTGMITAFLWPAVAAEAPAFVAADGGMFQHPLAVGPLVATRVVLVVGFVWLGAVSYRAAILPRAGSAAVVAGVLAMNLPTQPFGPVPWAASVIGATVFGLGLVVWGLALWNTGAMPEPQNHSSGPEGEDPARRTSPESRP